MNHSDFNILESVKKGNFGEELIIKMFEGSISYPLIDGDFEVYTHPNSTHLFDLYCIKKQGKIIEERVEVKTKPKRLYENDTGIDIKYSENFKDFLKFNIDILIIFVDQDKKQIYGNYFSKLEKGYSELSDDPNYFKSKFIGIWPKEDGGIRYWNIAQMIFIRDLTEKEVEILKQYSTDNYHHEEDDVYGN